MHILIAPNAYKNSLTAIEAAEAIRLGLEQSDLNCTSECFPVGDGGDGTGSLIVRQCRGKDIRVTVPDPFGRMIESSFGLIDNEQTAVIEMANASGLRLLAQHELNPLRASSAGTGELIRAALDRGVKRIVIGMGGSATVDGGTGILQALGIRFLDDRGQVLSGMPESLVRLNKVDASGLDPRVGECEFVVLCDVDNPLLGKQGAAAVFGPQKGANPDDVQKLDAALTVFSEVTLKQTGRDMATLMYGGTAGGAAAGLCAWLNANLVNGIDYFLQLTGFDAALQRSGLLITGEGSIDLQTLQGKAPAGVARKAKERGLPVIAFSGRVELDNHDRLKQCFDVVLPIGNEPCDLQQAMRLTSANLTRTARELGNLLALNPAR
ncbi:glycerate kinase [Pedobacter sp. BS3]|uniref:glycerate kinase n=1 Tax=Pedobacter sp. BS3 TaxID=2567937 RepID=UPI0011EE8C9C|nr:glycerate kinase [Pedobacter sp. BS3]TZF83171.1 glycerate kinase [Pedobacter sp. BS3]